MSGTWVSLTHKPTFSASTMLLLTDGCVMCQEQGGMGWWKLKPDAAGSYVHGTWSPLAPMHNTRLYFASAVLADGRVIVAGGEYSDAGSETNKCEIYNPRTDTWTVIGPPAGWANIGDGASTLLRDGRLLIGNAYNKQTAIYDPAAGAWSAGPVMNQLSSEESWALLPDDSVIAPQCFGHPGSERFVPSAGSWINAGSVPADLVEDASKEIGPAVLLPNGHVFFLGATGHSALYSTATGWTAGPTLPKDSSGKQLGAKDAPGCLLINGKVLCAVGPVDGSKDYYGSPTSFFEFDGVAFHAVAKPANAGGPPYTGRMMLLPNGEVAFAAGTPDIYIYQPSGGPHAAWRPSITACATTLFAGFSHTLHGRQINGLSQAVGYGDDAMAATNYPLVRLRHIATGKITYCRTWGHDTMGVATGAAIHSTHFGVPFSAPKGASELYVVANGIESCPVCVFVVPIFHLSPIELLFSESPVEDFISGLTEGPAWVLGPNGPITAEEWSPDVVKEARAAREQLLKSLNALRKLGDRVYKERADIAAAAPPAVDEDAEAAKAKRKPRALA